MAQAGQIFLVDGAIKRGIHWAAVAFWCKERALQR